MCLFNYHIHYCHLLLLEILLLLLLFLLELPLLFELLLVKALLLLVGMVFFLLFRLRRKDRAHMIVLVTYLVRSGNVPHAFVVTAFPHHFIYRPAHTRH